MAEEKRHASAIYAGLDKTEKMPVADAARDDASAAAGQDAAGTTMPVDAQSVGTGPESRGQGAGSKRSDGSAPRAPRRGAGLKAALAGVAVLCVALIGVSAFALAGGFAPQESAKAASAQAAGEAGEAEEAADASGSDAADANADAADDADADAADDADGAAKDSQGSQDAAASTGAAGSGGSGTAAGSGSGSGSNSGSNSGSTSGSSSSAGGSGGGASSGSGSQQPAGLSVAVSIDSSAAGSPVSLVTTVTLEEGATAYDALLAAAQQAGLSVNASPSQFGMYVKGIGGLAEFDRGDESGWTYYVNGVFINNAASGTVLSNGDAVSWVYVTEKA